MSKIFNIRVEKLNAERAELSMTTGEKARSL
jgi:hypothetical protein